VALLLIAGAAVVSVPARGAGVSSATLSVYLCLAAPRCGEVETRAPVGAAPSRPPGFGVAAEATCADAAFGGDLASAWLRRQANTPPPRG